MVRFAKRGILKMNILITIAGRAGSKGLPGKNIRPFCGKPLVLWSVEHACDFMFMENNDMKNIAISVCSDSIALLNMVEAQYNNTVYTMTRPKELSIDESPKMDVLRYMVGEYEKKNAKVDQVIDLDITNPMRNVYDIMSMSMMQEKNNVDSVISVVAGRRNPYFNQIEGTHNNVNLVKRSGHSVTRRQDCPQIWDMNCCIYVYSRDFLMERECGWSKSKTHPLSENSMIYPMPDYTFCETDTLMDFDLAEYLFKKYMIEKNSENH